MPSHLSQQIAAFVQPFFALQYPTEPPEHIDSFPDSKYYSTGCNDIYLIITCIAAMAILRDALRLGVFEPFARWKLSRDLRQRVERRAAEKSHSNGSANGMANGKVNGVANGVANGRAANGHANGHAPRATKKELQLVHRRVLRFAEQGWSVVYYTLQWLYGVYVHRNLPTRILDPTDLWLNYPHFPLAGPLKFYYLTQTAFYFHQMLILNAEARRKDHYQMMLHHIITIALMAASYFYNFTRVGCLIMVLMDCSDIFLPLAKMISYIDISQTLCDCVFGVFVLSWLVTRNILYLRVVVSVYFDVPRLVEYVYDPARGRYATKNTMFAFNAALWILQVLQIIWFGMIVRVVIRVLMKKGASDTRSDGEDDDEDTKDD
ncbi:hypothetical protein HGRIS_009810 [Hohenbuehelia grisea]|uniref:TLC domain-containing protein n=1 Tax=Hohenbuehelia grisea TaxID=104357 RepID=A0ABR3J293_9AGAR